MKKITESIFYIGADDRELDLFEGQYETPEANLVQEEYLKKLDMGVMGVHYEQTNYMPSGVQHKWHVMFYETTQKIPADERLSEEQRKQAQKRARNKRGRA